TFDILSGNSQVREFADAVKGMLDEAGFSTEVRIQESATYFDDYRFGNLGNICWFGWGGWTLDFDNTYYSMYKTGESYNPGFSNAEVDDLLVQQRATLDQAERLDIAKQINAILIEEAPDVALYQSTTLWAVNNNVHNLYIPPDERFWWAGAWID
ncbi:MAG: hypothetical protein KC438_16390, partial [Thermomicrobiales bacterium]|nr:hypothetical protein [Thermomicrobiales bacterium]